MMKLVALIVGNCCADNDVDDDEMGGDAVMRWL